MKSFLSLMIATAVIPFLVTEARAEASQKLVCDLLRTNDDGSIAQQSLSQSDISGPSTTTTVTLDNVTLTGLTSPGENGSLLWGMTIKFAGGDEVSIPSLFSDEKYVYINRIQGRCRIVDK